MLHTFTGPAKRRAFWGAVAGLHGRIVSASAATLVLRCSFEQVHRLIDEDALEAWTYRDAVYSHCQFHVVSIPSLVHYGIRVGRFRSARDDDLSALNVSEEEFTAMQAKALADAPE